MLPFLLSERLADPHCVKKFAPVVGAPYWPTKWHSMSFFFILIASWSILTERLLTVLFTLLSAFSPLVCLSLLLGCAAPLDTLSLLFFACRLAQSVLSWLQLLMFSFSPMSPRVLLLRHSLFGFDSVELRTTPRVFVYSLKSVFLWRSRNDFRFSDVLPGAVSVFESVRARAKFNLPLFFKPETIFSVGRWRCCCFCGFWSSYSQFVVVPLFVLF